MSEHKHTPGPWVALDLAGTSRTYIFARDGQQFPIASTETERYGDERTGDEIESNAHLIAAAPDLLAACERLEHATIIYGDRSYFTPWALLVGHGETLRIRLDVSIGDVRAILAAIAAARGEVEA